jgi:histidinol-phosphate/aromatic aminotransferase/cobyric acid decarboxylase-like protein
MPSSTKLNRNEFFFEHGLQVQMALAERPEPRQYAHPAFSQDLRARLAEFIDAPPQHIALGHGAEDLLLKLLLLFRPTSGAPTDLVLADFSWGEYRRMATGLGFRIHDIPVRDRTTTEGRWLGLEPNDISACLERLLGEGKQPLVLIATTNNPTGSRVDPRALRDLVGAFADAPVTFILDAVYEPMPAPIFSAFWHCERVFVLGSFSKFFGLPGLRLGFCVGKLPAPFNLALGPSASQCAAALAALDDHEHYAAVRREMMTHARALSLAYSGRQKCTVFATAAPFILVRVEGCTIEGQSSDSCETSTQTKEPAHSKDNELLSSILGICERESGVWPKVFEHKGLLWMRFGLGPHRLIGQVQLFLDRLAEHL